MAQFTVNTQRFDPYKNFKFRVKWDGRYVAGVSKVSALKRTTEVVKHREGGDPSSSRKSPGRTEYDAITLERGVTHDVEFERWANKVWNFGAGLGAEVSLRDFRKDLIIELYNEAGQLALAYKLYRCWVSEFQALPDLDANANAVRAVFSDHAAPQGVVEIDGEHLTGLLRKRVKETHVFVRQPLIRLWPQRHAHRKILGRIGPGEAAVSRHQRVVIEHEDTAVACRDGSETAIRGIDPAPLACSTERIEQSISGVRWLLETLNDHGRRAV